MADIPVMQYVMFESHKLMRNKLETNIYLWNYSLIKYLVHNCNTISQYTSSSLLVVYACYF